MLLPPLALCLVAGCAGKAPSSDTAITSKVNSLRGYVRLTALIAGHPLQVDVRRLRTAEAGLRGAAGRVAASQVPATAAGGGYTLNALPTDITLRAAGATQARGERREDALSRLQRDARSQLQAFQSERKQRQERLLAQRRDELEAVDALKVAEDQRLARDDVFAGVEGQIASKGNEVVNAQARIGVVQGQLDAPEAKLSDTVDLFLIPHNLLREQRRKLRQRITELENELAAIKRQGLQQADQAALAVSNRRKQEIENELDSLREDAETQFLVRDQEDALQRSLATEAALSKRAQEERIRLLNAGLREGGAGAVSLSSVFPQATAHNGIVGAQAAAARVARQRQRLELFLQNDVADAVRDAAQARHLDVILVGGDTVASGDVRVQGRRDMTRQFASWIKPGAALALTSRSAAAAATTKAAH